MLTIFSAPKPFEQDHIALIQRNAIRSWTSLDPQVQVLLMGDESGIAQVAADLGVRWIPTRKRSPGGTPLLDDIFRAALDAARHPTLCYVNSDIVLMDDFLPTIGRVRSRLERFLIVGTRWDLDLQHVMDFEPGWAADLREELVNRGKLHHPMGSDYFIYPRDQMKDMLPFALGRAGWDNWMIYHARRHRIPVVDASRAITAVHQNHDYSHLPGGRPHYRHPESSMNVRLAGGQPSMFRLRDADWIATPDELRRKSLREWDWPRKIEADMIARIGPGKLANGLRIAFHPRFAMAYLSDRLQPASDSGVDSGVRHDDEECG
jgi:hypothetical protein